MFFGQKKILGLDIGSTSIKLAEVDVSRKGAVLQSFAMVKTPPHSVIGGDIQDSGMVSGAISQLLQELSTKRKLVASGLSGSSVIVKKISVPKMEKDLLAEQLKWEAEQYIPFDINEVNIEYNVLKNSNQNSETMDLLLVAARQDGVYRLVEAVSGSGLNCEIIDVSGFAFANCFEKNYGVIGNQSLCLLNIGSAVTNFVVVESGEVVFCRDIPVGGGIYTTEIQKGMGISQEEAEAMKISSSMGQPAPEEVTAIINQTHEAIVEEIGSSIEFFISTSQGSPVAQCFLTGGGSKIAGLLEFMSRTIKVPCEVFDPFLNIKFNDKVLSPQYIGEIKDFAAITLGLGMRKAGDR